MKKKLSVALGAALIAAALAYLVLSALDLLKAVPDSTPVTDTGERNLAPQVASAGTATATAVSTGTAPGEAAMSPEDFSQKLVTTLAKLPTRSQLRALSPQEVHHTPKILLEAGLELGDVTDAIEKNPALAPQGVEFFGTCAKRDDLATAIRATCLANMRDLATQTNSAADEKGVPAEISNLATKLRE